MLNWDEGETLINSEVFVSGDYNSYYRMPPKTINGRLTGYTLDNYLHIEMQAASHMNLDDSRNFGLLVIDNPKGPCDVTQAPKKGCSTGNIGRVLGFAKIMLITYKTKSGFRARFYIGLNTEPYKVIQQDQKN